MTPLKTLSIFIAASMLFAAAGGAPARAQAGDDEKEISLKIRVVDDDRVKRESLMYQDIGRQLRERQKKLSDEIRAAEEEQKKAIDELNRKRVLLSPEKYNEEARKIQESQNDLQRKFQARNQEFNSVRADAEKAWFKAFGDAILEMVNDKKYTLILRRRDVTAFAELLDATDQVIAIINKKVSAYQLPSEPPKPDK